MVPKPPETTQCIHFLNRLLDMGQSVSSLVAGIEKANKDLANDSLNSLLELAKVKADAFELVIRLEC